MRNFVFLGPTIFDHLRGEGVWLIWFGLEFLDNYGKLSIYPSPKPTLTLISHLRAKCWLRGRLGGHCIGTCITLKSVETNVPFGSLKMITSPHFNCFIVILAIIIIIMIINIIININNNIGL